MERIIIGICGGTGSGKTTLAKNIFAKIGEKDALLISMDSYYKKHKGLSYEERAKLNYDHPDAIDMELLLSQLKDLKKGKSIKCPIYDFEMHNRASDYIMMDSKKIIIIEGILLFSNSELVDMLDIKVFVDTDADVRILRRMARDVKERGRSIDSVMEQYLTTVKPMHDRYIEPNKKLADVIVPEGGENKVAYDMLVNTIVSKINDKKA